MRRTAAGARARTVPGMFDILSGRVSVTALREVQIEDLLRREPIITDLAQVRELATGETVLVTGAGGSIGSEFCRQLARLEPARIIMLGHGENSIFDILARAGPARSQCHRVPVIADVRDRERLQHVFESLPPVRGLPRRRPQARARSWKTNIAEAVTNNVLGTRNVAELSAEYRRQALRADLDRQGRAAHQRDGRHQAGGRADRAARSRRRRAEELRRGAVRQRARQPGQRGADVPAPDPRAAARSRSPTPRCGATS